MSKTYYWLIELEPNCWRIYMERMSAETAGLLKLKCVPLLHTEELV